MGDYLTSDDDYYQGYEDYDDDDEDSVNGFVDTEILAAKDSRPPTMVRIGFLFFGLGILSG